MRNQLVHDEVQRASNFGRGEKLLDGLDIKIINLMEIGSSNKKISQKLDIPLSTIQRRTRILLAKGYVRLHGEINYRKLGYRRGVFHVYVSEDSVRDIAEKIADIAGVRDVALVIGNADIVGVLIFKDADEILNLKASVKNIKGVDTIVWTEEEVYAIPERRGAIA